MYDIGAIRVGIGVVILLLIVLLPVRQSSTSRRAFLGFFVGIVIALALAALIFHLGDFVVEGAGDEYVKGELDRIQQAQAGAHVPRNLLIVEGSSQTDLGIDPYIVEAELKRLGYEATVVTLAADGGNHLERYQHMRRLLAEMQRHGLAYSPNTRLLLEVHSGYDVDPLRYLQRNRNALRTYYYATFDNFLFATRYYRLLGAELKAGKHQRSERQQLGLLLGHTLMWEPKTGFLPLMTRFDALMGAPTYTPFPRSIPDRKFRPYDAQRFAADSPGGKRSRIPYAAIDARTERLQALFGDALTGIAYFQVPSLDLKKVSYGHQFCDSLKTVVCIDGADPVIYGPLDHAEYYFNRDHLSLKGAQLFSVYLADQIAVRGLVTR